MKKLIFLSCFFKLQTYNFKKTELFYKHILIR